MVDKLQNLTKEWFEEECLGDPSTAYKSWQHYLKEKPESTREARYKKLLELASDLTEGAIRHYFKRPEHLSKEKLMFLDDLSRSLGFEPPERPRRRNAVVNRHRRHIAFLAEFTDIPSLPFHFEIIKNVTLYASKHNYTVSIHAVRQNQLTKDIKKLIRISRPDAVVMLRLNPELDALNHLAAATIPVVLIHANRFKYGQSVLGHVIPQQEKIERILKNWAKETLDANPKTQFVIVSVCPEVLSYKNSYERIPDIDTASIRNDRIAAIESALESFQTIHMEVEDYSFRHALKIYEKHPDAHAYICLSDQIAIALGQIFQAAKGKKAMPKIIGFDNTSIAEKEHITCFSQNFDEIGRLVADCLAGGFVFYLQNEKWPAFEEIFSDITFIMRD